jgi:RNA polymerase sigma-70 factor (ECF subfamily)
MPAPPDPDLPAEDSAPGLALLPDLTESLDLARRAREGDGVALERFLARYYDRVRRIARIRLGPRLQQRIDADDIVQDALMVAVRRLGDFDPRDRGALIQWLARIVENQIRDARKHLDADKRCPDREVPLDAGGDDSLAPIQLAGREPTPSVGLARQEEQARYDGLVAQLPEAHRELILLREFSGLTWERIAEETGAPSVNAAQQKYHRAKLKLGQLYKQLGDR